MRANITDNQLILRATS